MYGKEGYNVVICIQFPRRQQAQQLVHEGYSDLEARVLQADYVSATFMVPGPSYLDSDSDRYEVRSYLVRERFDGSEM